MSYNPDQPRADDGKWTAGGAGPFKAAGSTVDGRTVRDHIPNQASIGATLDDYDVLPGLREVRMSDFTLDRAPRATDRHTRDLAEQIRHSKELNPLIVAVDAKGPYILEGGHRYEALKILGAKSFPAMVVLEPDAEAWQPATRVRPKQKTKVRST